MAFSPLFAVLQVMLVLVASMVNQHWLGWLAFQLSIGLIEIRRHRLSPPASMVEIIAPFTGSLLLAVGYWGLWPLENSFLHQTGLAMMLVGIGASLRWFPIPETAPYSRHFSARGELIWDSLCPVLLAALFLNRSVQTVSWSEAELGLLAVVSLFSFGLSGLRLTGQLSPQQRLRLLILNILSQANIATVLMGWEILHTDWNWSESSNLPTGLTLFMVILIVESLASVLVDFTDSSRTDVDLNAKPHWFLTGMNVIGNWNLAGIPPTPGGIWRVTMWSVLLLPQATSNVTHLPEPHPGFVSLSICFITCSSLVMAGHLRATLAATGPKATPPLQETSVVPLTHSR